MAKDISELDKFILAKIEELKERISIVMETQAVRLVPVDTGLLKGSIRKGVDGNIIWVGAGFDKEVNYTKYVEYGTATNRAQPFLRPALFLGLKSVKEQVKKTFS